VAVSPPLSKLKDDFDARLGKAENDAVERLDELRSQRNSGGPVVVRVELGLKNREVATAADVDALLAELRERLMLQLKNGVRVRLMGS
jgi:hypothetical protein